MTANQPSSRLLGRRAFLKTTLLTGTAVAAQGPRVLWSAEASPPRKAAIIGHTGQGNYGHGLEMVFKGRAGIETVAVADPDPGGRAGAQERSGARRAYADYREMLRVEKPDLVSVAPRCTDQHHAMGVAALEAGAHIYMEKPFTRSLAEADDLLTRAQRLNRKIAVAHQMRMAPSILFLKEQLSRGLIGDLLQIHAHGKQDNRAGGEDMLVLGTHLFDLIRFLGGSPIWCTARILQSGRPVTSADAHPATENIGPIVGDEIEAQFSLPDGVWGTFTSRGRQQKTAGPWGMDLVGSRGIVRVDMHMVPRLYLRDRKERQETGWEERWIRLPGDPCLEMSADEQGLPAANRRVVEDWLVSIAEDRQPVCSGLDAMKSLEMIHAVFTAGLNGQRVTFPLPLRNHPLDPPSR